MKLSIGIALMLGVVGCGSDVSRDDAISEIQDAVPGATRSEAGRMIDFICSEFDKGWGGAVITEDANVPYEERETFSYVILKAAEAECPQNVVDAETWRKYNGWN